MQPASAILSRMLLTICPNCTAQFKVQPEQLNVRQGRVMCGRCRSVFNAFQSLSRLEETDTSPSSVGVQATVVVPASKPAPVDEHLFLRPEPPPTAVFSSSKPFPSPAEVDSSTSTGYVQAERITPSVQAEVGSAQNFTFLDLVPLQEPSATSAIDLSSASNPLLLEAPSAQAPPAKASPVGWLAGVFLLILGLLAQLTFMFRTTLAIDYPELRPSLSQMCDIAKCALPWGRDSAQFEIVGSELMETPGKPGRILLTATLINRAKTKQDLPSLDLKLTDNANQVVVGRALHPRDYLGRAIEKDEGLAPNAELYLSLTLDISGKQLASGYGLLPFYP